MKDTQTKVFGLLCVLVGVWTAVYWLYEPGEPPVSSAPPSSEAAERDRNVPVRDPMAELSPPIKPERRTETPPTKKPEPAPVAKTPVVDSPRTRVVPPEYWEYTVQQGDGSMEAIARKLLGDGRLWTKIAEANPLLDARKLIPGRTRLKIPKDLSNIQGKEVQIAEPLPPTPASKDTAPKDAPKDAPAAARTYVVKSGDTLSGISKEVYGTSALWRKIYEANTDVMDSPDAVKPGTTLRIPPKD
jgi:nucleoid-associated protein YgaU